jgi:oligopeptide transport system substrate-binding protein
MFLTACWGGGNQANNADDKDGDKGSVPQVLNINIKEEPYSLHPGLANDSISGTVLRQTFEGLTRINEKGEPEKAMAEDIQISDDKLTYTFKIRDAKWSNGDPVTAYDFEYAWKWVLDAKNGANYAYQLYYLKNGEKANKGEVSLDEVGVKALDEKTLEVKLENPTPFFLELVAFYTYYPINSKIAKENPDWYKQAGENYTSNGPFKMVSWEKGKEIVLEKNENYWDADTVKLEKINMAYIADATTELEMFKRGELHWAGMPMHRIPVEALPQLKDEGLLQSKVIHGTYWYKFNTQNKFLKNVNIRKALTYAIDRKAIVENISQGGEIPAMAAVPPTIIPENEKGYFKDNDVEKAKEHLEKGLKELGLSSAADIKLTLSYNTDELHQKIAQAIQEMWKKNLGIEVQLTNNEFAVHIDNLTQGNYDIGRIGWLADFTDPMNFLELYRDKNGGNNNTFWENAEYKRLLDEAKTELDSEKRQQLIKDAEQILMDEMPIAPIYFYTNPYVKAENLKGVVLTDSGEIQFKWAYFE